MEVTTDYVATARRSGDWWAISVNGLPGVFTQAKRLDQVADVAQEAIALFLDIPLETIHVSLGLDVDAMLQAELDELATLRALADTATADYAAAMRRVIKGMSSDFSLRDIAVMTRVSFQRVSQILADQRPLSATVRTWSNAERARPVTAAKGRPARSPAPARTQRVPSAAVGDVVDRVAAVGGKAMRNVAKSIVAIEKATSKQGTRTR